MKKIKDNIEKLIKGKEIHLSRINFFFLIVFLFWIKNIFAYFVDFKLVNVENFYQFLILMFNPLPFALIIFSLFLLLKRKISFFISTFSIYAVLSIFLLVNVIYFREFNQFISTNVIAGYKYVDQGLSSTGLSLYHWTDIFYFLDLIVLLLLFAFRKIKITGNKVNFYRSVKIFVFGFMLLLVNLSLAEISRPQLIIRQFDNNYLVRYLGINIYSIEDYFSTMNIDKSRKEATYKDANDVVSYIKDNEVPKNVNYYGKAKGKNVFVIHLESLQQFSINLKADDKPVMPFLDSLYDNKDSISFDNFFHQVGQGKTSDAENMLENSTYGLQNGSLFTKLGSTQIFQAMPAILNQELGYSSSVFHGNVGSFWNRNNTYKNLGYQNFFDASFFDTSGRKSETYGLKDKLLFSESIKYLEKMQQPFYTKYLTVTNHLPYDLDPEDQDPNFNPGGDEKNTVQKYLVTNHYLDESLKEFFDYLKESGIYNDSIFVLYGDHYGISNSESSDIGPYIGKSDINDFDNIQLQRVPFIIHMPGSNMGEIKHNYGGEIDVMPTIESLLGVNSDNYVQFGQDLLSEKRRELVIFRNKDWVNENYSYNSGTIYDNSTGQEIPKEKQSAQLKIFIEETNKLVNTQLNASDTLNLKNLLRFFNPLDFIKINPNNFNYGINSTIDRLNKTENNLGDRSNSIFSRHGKHTTVNEYKTNAPEIKDGKTESSNLTVANDDDAKEGKDN